MKLNTYKVNQKYIHFIYFLFSIALVSFMPVITKLLNNNINNIEIVFFRYLSGTLIIITALLLKPKSSIKKNIKNMFQTFSLLQCMRVFSGILSLFFMFSASTHMSVLSLNCIGYLVPIFGAFFALVLLNEKVSRKKIISFLMSMIGIIIYFAPWNLKINYNLYFYFAIIYCIFSALENFFIKQLTTKYDFQSILLFVNFFATLFLLYPTIKTFNYPTTHEFLYMLTLGLLAVVSQFFYLKSVNFFHLTSVMSFRYLSVIFSALYGFIIFNETVSFIALISCILIIASGFLTLHEFKNIKLKSK